jgi:hypothetical protein
VRAEPLAVLVAQASEKRREHDLLRQLLALQSAYLLDCLFQVPHFGSSR